MKCSNCGSSDFRQLSEDLFECVYCSTKIQNDNSIKDDFVEDIKSAKVKKSVKYIKALVSEDQFYKKALAHLGVSRHTPSDLFTKGEFGFVEYDYKIFAVLDVDFTVMTVSAGNDNLVSLLSHQQVNAEASKLICVELSKDTENDFMNDVLNYADSWDSKEQFVSSDQGKGKKVVFPSQEVVKAKIEESIASFKNKILAEDRLSNYVAHKVNKIDMYALPVYSLRFTYKGKQYKLSSSAHEIRFVGDFPKEEYSITKQVEKKVLPITMASFVISICAIIFAMINLSNRLLSWVKYDIILAIASIVGFGVSWFAYKIAYRKKSSDIYEQKLNCLKGYLKQQGKELTVSEEEYIQKFLRWF